MERIKVMDAGLVNKIAAGEVVERPASVIKELCENAIDAGARSITAEMSGGGLSLLRVTDDGCGIPGEDVEVAFAQHATSKLRSAEELNSILTLGFRGEALASIAAVSMAEMTTKTAEGDTATRITINGGVTEAVTEASAPRGTTVTVRNLFYNTPARRNFLKKPGTEGGYVADVVTRLALGRPDIGFTFISDGTAVFQTAGGGELKNAALSVFGRDIAGGLTEVDYTRGAARVTGLLGKPHISRGNRSMEYFYINGRYIKNHVMQSAVEAAYKTRLTIGKFPIFILRLDVPPELVDVNVHPEKLEVRFHRDLDIYRIMLGAAEAALGGRFIQPGTLNPGPPHEQPLVVRERYTPPQGLPAFALPERREATEQLNVSEAASLYEAASITKDIADLTYIYRPRENENPGLVSLPTPEAPVQEPLRPRADYRVVGRFFGTYWLVEAGAGACYILDQHAAHERVLYDEIMAKLKASGAVSQRMVEPLAMKLTPGERQVLADNLTMLNNMGFELEDMYDDNVALRAVPYLFKRPADGGFFMELLDKLAEEEALDNPYEARLEAVSRIACRAAVKANDRLSEVEARVLVDKALSGPLTCPHGRPVLVEITRTEIEKMFKRIQ